MSERANEWPSTYVSILVCSRPQCIVVMVASSHLVVQLDSVFDSQYLLTDAAGRHVPIVSSDLHLLFEITLTRSCAEILRKKKEGWGFPGSDPAA